MKSINVIKGEIRELTPWGNKKELREGSLHFQSKEEIFVNRNRKNLEGALAERRINVVGKDRLGQIKHSKLHFKYLGNLRVEKILNPSQKTLEFIEKVGIYVFQEGTKGQELAEEIIKLYDSFILEIE